MEVNLVADIAALVLSYLLGSIPFGLLLTRFAGLGDVRSIGSGNIGATNVLRTGNKPLAAATLLGDMLKGTVAVLLANYFFDRDAALIAGLGAFLGHLFPVWLGFKGGKGVSTYIGILLGLSWVSVLAFGAIWILVAVIFRLSSLAGLTATFATPIILFALGERKTAFLFVILTALVWIMHRANIGRLIAGTEPRISAKK
jgi:glycerol-3-phosphate acyltransferase PlsY